MLMDALTIFAALVGCGGLYLGWGHLDIVSALAEKVEEQDREIDELRNDLAEFARLAAQAGKWQPLDIFGGHP